MMSVYEDVDVLNGVLIVDVNFTVVNGVLGSSTAQAYIQFESKY